MNSKRGSPTPSNTENHELPTKSLAEAVEEAKKTMSSFDVLIKICKRLLASNLKMSNKKFDKEKYALRMHAGGKEVTEQDMFVISQHMEKRAYTHQLMAGKLACAIGRMYIAIDEPTKAIPYFVQALGLNSDSRMEIELILDAKVKEAIYAGFTTNK